MEKSDTEMLLRDLSAGIKMAVSALDQTLPKTRGSSLRNTLENSKSGHLGLSLRAKDMLSEITNRPAVAGKLAQSMSKMKTGMMMALSPGDDTIAELICDGCNMGVKSIARSLNEHTNATRASRELAYDLIALDRKLASDMAEYL